MRIYKYYTLASIFLCIYSATSLQATSFMVTTNGDSGTNSTTFRYALLNALPNDTVTFVTPLSGGNTITLTSPLPIIQDNLTITAPATVTIDGNNQYSALAITGDRVTGANHVTIQNLIIQNALSQGGAGGAGGNNTLYGAGGGGGAAGGAALYLHTGTSLTINGVNLTGNRAIGGAGGATVSSGTVGSGGGGGGFGSGGGSNNSAGGAGPAGSGGGGGGGNASGGSGGTLVSGVDQPGANGGISHTTGGGGGGGGVGSNASLSTAGGGSFYVPNAAPSDIFGGGSPSGTLGGGGAGTGGRGGTPSGGVAGIGGNGTGIDTLYGGGGGGGGGSTPTAHSVDAGAGWGMGGGGGSYLRSAGDGGILGGGGGGAGSPLNSVNGGKGGFGGGGGGAPFYPGTSLFGGGTGGSNGSGGKGGGGGAAMGGSIFIQNGATLTIGDGFAPSGNTVTPGTASSGGAAGSSYGPDIFVRSGGTLIFANVTGNISIPTAICSDEGAGGTSGGGLYMNGSKTLTLGGANTYSGGTTISNAGTISVTSDGNLGSTADPLTTGVTLNNGTLAITGSSFNSNRTFTLSGVGNFGQIDTGGHNATLGGKITGAGSLVKIGSGTLTLTGTANDYTGNTSLEVGAISIASNTSLGSGTISIESATLQITADSLDFAQDFYLSDTAIIDTGSNTITFSGSITGPGSLTMSGIGGTLILTNGDNNYSDGTFVTAGTLKGNTSTLQGQISLSNNSVVVFNQITIGTYSGQITGAGGLSVTGGGLLTLSGTSNDYSAGTTVTGSLISIPSSTSIGSSSGTIVLDHSTLISTGASVTLAQPFTLTGLATFNTKSNALTLSGILSGGGTLYMTGVDGTLTLTNPSNSYTGNNVISAGTLIGNAASLQGNIENNSILQFNQTTTGTFGGSITGSGRLIVTGGGNLTLSSGSNSYSGTTTLEGSTTLQIGSSGSIGSSTISMGPATLQITAGPIDLSNPFSLTGASTFSLGANALNLSGSMTGNGSLILTGSGGTLTLNGTNDFTGGITISSGTLIGNSSSLPGNIANSGALEFNQTFDGTYAGVLSGTGPLTVTGGGKLQMTGNSEGYGGSITVSGTNLNINGMLASSPPQLMTVQTGGTLSGTGTVGSVTINNGATLQPGNSVGTINLTGNLILNTNSNTAIEVGPDGASSIEVAGTATLAGPVTLSFDPGFYGFTKIYDILIAEGDLGMTTFSNLINPNSNFISQLSYSPDDTTVILSVEVIDPFYEFPFSNYNTESVGNNIAAINLAGTLITDSDLDTIIEDFILLDNAQINAALDQLHPAQFSAFAELQTEVGAQLLSIFHRKPVTSCCWYNGCRVWVEPYGNWLKEKNRGEELGFTSNSRGVTGGIDAMLSEGWSLGIGGAWNDSSLFWHEGRGYGTVKGYYGAFYLDYMSNHFFMGTSLLGGVDQCHSTRHITFQTVDEKAFSSRHNTEFMGQFGMALFFGPSKNITFPYVNVDLLYLSQGEAIEEGAPGLNLIVQPNSGTTLRTEAGFSLQCQSMNEWRNVCIAPLFGLGWAMEYPLTRHQYSSTFEDQTIPFYVRGWNKPWQLVNVRLGLTFTANGCSFYGGYVGEISPMSNIPLFNQRANLRLDYNW